MAKNDKPNKADVKATDAMIEDGDDDMLRALRDLAKGDMPAIITPHGVLPAEKDDR